MNHNIKVPVLIVGAGPAGLVMALWLSKKGVSVRIVDRKPSVDNTSRAVAIQPRTMEFYLQLGIADEIIAAGVVSRDLHLRQNRQTFNSFRLGDFAEQISPFPFLVFISQDLHEKILIKKLESLNIKIERQTELLQFVQNKFQVEAVLKTPNGEENVTVSYLCGCDGENSSVRRILGIKFFKKTYQNIFFIADVVTELSPSDKDSASAVQVYLSRKNFFASFPINSKNVFRIIGIVPPESENKVNISFKNISDSVIESTGLKINKVNFFSTYNVTHRIASHFQQGRTFLVSDAAHTHSPILGQGMNVGIGDAVNLSWKLAAVLNGQISSKILATYESERILVAEHVSATTDNALRLISEYTLSGANLRTYFLPVFFKFIKNIKPLMKFTFKLLSQTGSHYQQSPLSHGTAGRAKSGDRLPWLKTNTQDNYESLKLKEWHIQIYGTTNETFGSVAHFRGFKIWEYEWTELAATLGFIKNGFYLIRPDGYIALSANNQNITILKDYLNEWEIETIQNIQHERPASKETELLSADP